MHLRGPLFIMNEILLNKIYKHYKGNVYKVVGFAKHSETCEDMVVYESVKNGDTWCRPRNMWFDKIDENTTRFTLID